jgi:hypothetical protein
MACMFLQPFFLAFGATDLNDINKRHVMWIFIFVEIVLILDIVFNYLTSFQNEITKITINNLKYTSLNYLTSWFIFDLTMCLPLDIIYYAIEKSFDDFYYFTKWISILRIVKIFGKEHKMNYIEIYLKKVSTNIQIVRTTLFALIFLIFVHVITCFWIFIGYISYNSWTIYYGLINKDYDVTITYLNSIYFILVTVFTVGYGDITPKNFTEKLFNIFLMIFGIASYSFLITSLSKIFGQLSSFEDRKQKLQDTLDMFNNEYHFKDDLYDNIWKIILMNLHKNIVGINDVFDSLPFSIKTQLLIN